MAIKDKFRKKQSAAIPSGESNELNVNQEEVVDADKILAEVDRESNTRQFSGM